jgi:competence protein ComEC
MRRVSQSANPVVLWLPVGIGVGVALYFALPIEPDGVATTVIVASGLTLAAVFWRRPKGRLMAIIGLSVIAGFAAADTRTAIVAGPVLAKRTGPLALTATVVRTEQRTRGGRLTLAALDVIDGQATVLPDRVRITLRNGMLPLPSDHVRVRAILMPPPGPVAPGAFDFARQSWFRRIGAVGYALGPAQVIGSDRAGVSIWLAAIRTDLAGRIRDAKPGPGGAIAAALMTGERGAIRPTDLDAMRDAGLAHLLAISGLHVGLVAGLVFFAVRVLLVALPGIALRYPIKKWSAVAALVAAFAYLWLTGATVPTQRAFMMTAIVLTAVIVDRRAISMRLVAAAATVVLLIRPESLLGPSFQMSFAAVVALIAAYEAARTWFAERRRTATWSQRIGLYFAGIMFTTVIAGLATMPFAAFHFNRIAVYGLAANALAVPVTALWIMPSALFAYVLAPFGLEHWGLTPVAWGIDLVLWIAHTVSGWRGAALMIPSGPIWGLAMVGCGGLWLCLTRGPHRFAGVVAIVAGVCAPLTTTPPTILADGQGRYIAVHTEGAYTISRTARSFTAKMWLRRAAQANAPHWPKPNQSNEARSLRCTDRACWFRAPTGLVLISDDPTIIAQHCDDVVLVVSREPVRHKCDAQVVDRFDVWRHGAHAIWLGNEGVIVKTAHAARGARPWVATTSRQWPRRRPERPSTDLPGDQARENAISPET